MYRKILLALTLVAFTSPAFAHDGKHPDAPNPSPNATTSQEVGYTKVSVKYGRPGVKGREIWGKLVEYNGGDPRPWVAGANGSTIITFDDDITINGKSLKAGSYGLHMIPSKDDWIIIFNSDASRFGIMKYTPKTDALRLTVTPKRAPFQEWLAYEFDKTGELTATLSMHWENLKVDLDIVGPDKRTGKDKHADH